MDGLVKLMNELSMVLKARLDAGARATALAEEVKTLPKLSVIAPEVAAQSENEDAEQVVLQLQLQMELQNLLHAKEEALETINLALGAVSQIRVAVNEFQSNADKTLGGVVDDYDSRINGERMAYAELHQRRQDLLFRLSQKLSALERIDSS